MKMSKSCCISRSASGTEGESEPEEKGRAAVVTRQEGDQQPQRQGMGGGWG
jgi:hypothetical protein